MSVTVKVILWSVFYAAMIAGIISIFQVVDVGRIEAKSESLTRRLEVEKARKEYSREDRARMNEQRGARDKAFVECANAIGLEQCSILSDWVEPDGRVMIPFFGMVQ